MENKHAPQPEKQPEQINQINIMEQSTEPNVIPSRIRAKKKPKWFYPTLGLALAIVIIGIYYVYAILDSMNKIHKDPDDSRFKAVQDDESPPPPVWEGKDRVNILLMGADARGMKKNEIPRSDSMIIASIDPVSKKATLFSILRDTYGVIPKFGNDRINAAIIYGGPQLAMQTVSELTGLPIQYYVYTDFQGFIALIDALGGIDFEVEKRMRWKDSHDDPIYHIDLQPGMQHMDGKTALAYVRFRHDALSDYTRTLRQRNFLSAIAEKLKTTSSLLKLPMLLDSVVPHVETNLGLEDMLKLAALGFSVDTKSIATVQLPPTELLVEKKVNGAEVIAIRDGANIPAYVQEQLDAQAAAAAEEELAKDDPVNDGANVETGATNSSEKNTENTR